jgi:hypothetical protein
MSDFYILDGHTPVPCADILTWGRWFETADRHVAETWVTPEIRVSTIFLGLDHGWGPPAPPILFETMVFWEGGPLDQEQERYASWDAAEQGHTAMVYRVRAALAVAPLPPAPPGSLCEACLDAPAVALAPAPWGGERGVCAACAPDAPPAP